MSLKEKAKNKVKNKVKKVVLKMLKPFLPFIAIIVGIIFAVCTVSDALFTTEDDMQIAEQLSNENYEEQYSQWLQLKNTDATIITDGKGLIPTRYVYLANTWIYSNYISFRYENSPYYSVHINYILELMYQHQFGASFVAMADGTVIKATYSSSYGNLVMIDHRQWDCYFICTWF